MMGGGMMGSGLFHGARSAATEGHQDEEAFGSVYDPRVIRRMLPYLAPYKHLVAVSVVSMLVYTGSQVAVPRLIGLGIDKFMVSKDMRGLSLIVGIFMGKAVLNWWSSYAQQVAMIKVGQGLLYSLRRDMFRHCQKLSLTFYDKTEVGRIMSRVHGDVGQLQEFMSMGVMTLGDLLSLVGIVVALLTLNLKLGLISMAVLPVLTVIMAVWQPFARKVFLRVRYAIAVVNSAFNENIQGVRVVQSMNRQSRNLEVFDKKNQAHLSASLEANRLAATLLGPVELLTGVAIALTIYFGARMIADDTLAVGALIAFVLYIQRFFDPIRNLTMQYTQLQRSMASGSRIFDLLDAVPDLVDAPGARDLPTLRGEIEFRDVSHSYVPGADVLKNVSFHIYPGETVAVVGPTGAGKTTLVSLLARFYEVAPGRGAILVDGHDIREVTRRPLSNQIGMGLQEPFLFSGTVRENIKYNHTDATDEQMIDAARAVGAHDFIVGLDDGYDTLLQERGLNLSLGQRQLLSFARAIVSDPRILVLDEATANIDSYTETLIQRALARLLMGRTAVVIAHRLSTIRGADKILVLNLGELVEMGTHGELIQENGLYAHLYQMNYAAIEAPLASVGNGGNGG